LSFIFRSWIFAVIWVLLTRIISHQTCITSTPLVYSLKIFASISSYLIEGTLSFVFAQAHPIPTYATKVFRHSIFSINFRIRTTDASMQECGLRRGDFRRQEGVHRSPAAVQGNQVAAAYRGSRVGEACHDQIQAYREVAPYLEAEHHMALVVGRCLVVASLQLVASSPYLCRLAFRVQDRG